MNTSNKKIRPSTSKPNGQAWQFGIRSILVFTFVVSIFMCWYQARLARFARIEEAESLLAAATESQYQFNPADLAKAVNQLRVMNRGDALSVLRQYARIYPFSDENSIANSLEYVLPLLFEQGESQVELEQGRLENPDWPKWLSVHGDLPFHTTYIIYRDPFDNVRAVETWFDKDLEFRKLPLQPKDNPIESIEAQLDRLIAEGSIHDGNAIKRQLRSVLVHLFPPQDWEGMLNNLNPDQRTAACRKLDVFWDRKTQRYQQKK